MPTFQIHVIKYIYTIIDLKMSSRRFVIQLYILQYLRDKIE